MTKYLIKRLLHGIISVIIVVGIIMILIYSLIDRASVFSGDTVYSHTAYNDKKVYMYGKLEEYGYLDYVPYSDYLSDEVANGNLSATDKTKAAKLGKTAEKDSDLTKQWTTSFTEKYTSNGYNVVRLDAIYSELTGKLYNGGNPALFAYKDISVFVRVWKYFTGIVKVDRISYVDSSIDIGERGLSFTWNDPAYGGAFAPAIMGNGTKHKYLLYFDDKFPFIHQNVFSIELGVSYSISQGNELMTTMTESQGALAPRTVIYPTGYVAERADDVHSATYVQNSLSEINNIYFDDDYTNVTTYKSGMSRMGYSFVMGIFATLLAYFLGVPLGILMARKKDKLADKLGTIYVVFITAVPSLAYILMFQSLGGSMGLPTTFDTKYTLNPMYYILPVVSLALPSIAGLMRWLRRYMVDQMASDYVKFARSGGLSETEIFTKHIFKNAAIPIIHGIPGSLLGALTGAIITERVYTVPGVGNTLTDAITAHDNAVIVGISLFYSILSIISIILGDILMALVDPRISFSTKGR